MGLTQNLGRLSPSIFSDASLNIGVGAAPSGSYKFEVTGTSKVSGVLTLGSTLSNGTYTYTLPSATGTLALVGGAGVGTVTSVAALTIGTTGTDLSSTVANSTTTPVITLNVPTASAVNRGALSSADWTIFNGKQPQLNGSGLVRASGTTITYDNSNYITLTSISATAPLVYNSSGGVMAIDKADGFLSGYVSATDWNTFNNKQATITLTTTGTSGAATFSANTLNIPNYGSALSGYLPLTGGTLTGALNGTSATFSGDIRAEYTSAIYLDYTPSLGSYKKGFSGINQSTGIARGLHIFNYDNDANEGINFWVGTNAAKVLAATIASTGAATFSSTVAVTTIGTTAALQVNLPADGNATILSSFGSSSAFGWYLRQDEVTTGDWRIFRRQANVDYQVLNLSRGSGAATFSGDFTSYGTFGSFGQLHIAGVTDSNKKLVFGYNTSANVGFIQAMQNGTAYSPLLLNSSGGNVLIGTTTDNGYKLLVSGTAFVSELRIGDVYTNAWTTDASWSSSQIVVPNGVLTSLATYIIEFDWNFNGIGSAPYLSSAATIFRTNAYVNSSGDNNEVALITSSHVGGSYIIYMAMRAAGGATQAGVSARFSWTPAGSGGTLTVRVKRIN